MTYFTVRQLDQLHAILDMLDVKDWTDVRMYGKVDGIVDVVCIGCYDGIRRCDGQEWAWDGEQSIWIRRTE